MYIVESECIYCGACVAECPESAVITSAVHSNEKKSNELISPLMNRGGLNIRYAINSDLCTECPDQQFPLCYSICPMNCIKINDERL